MEPTETTSAAFGTSAVKWRQCAARSSRRRLLPAATARPRRRIDFDPSSTKGEDVLGWLGDIDDETKENRNFRTVRYTGRHTQLTVMCIPAGEDIGREVHRRHDQFLRIEEGYARVELGPSEDEIEETHHLGADWALVVPAGVWHNVVNTGDAELKLYSLYSPPVHLDGTVHHTKAEADAAERIERALR